MALCGDKNMCMQVLNDETFAILVIMALFTTFMTTPMVMAIYRPARAISSRIDRRLQRESLQHKQNSSDKLRILACVHVPQNSPSVINLIESTWSTNKSTIKLYIMHLVELTERSSSIMMARRTRKNGLPCISRFRRGDSHDQVMAAFEAYGQLNRVKVRPTTAISALSTMHEDICQVAEERRVAMIILPFHKQWSTEAGEEVENVGWSGVNQRVLNNAPCSVAVLVDRGFGVEVKQIANVTKMVCIVFFSGPDSREALALGGRMAEHPAVKVTVERFVEKARLEGDKNIIELTPLSPEKCAEKNYNFSTPNESPERTVADFRRRWDGVANYVEKEEINIAEEVLAIGQSKEYELVVVGKGRFPPEMAAELAYRQAEHGELGPIGDLLASSGQNIGSSVLVIQQHNLGHQIKDPVGKIAQCNNDTVGAYGSSV
ncbi:hypothetical protein F0562_016350 [Nyssa sinensis]|uniref:Cation/H+ exchanger domain-containing protein n=1 Tax=Nyssa sinensis TaxID=561372 RepID=A0A5J4ZMH2_9ASTE|nr:hypothetical protein F0562_016350 [Nyssa sinensis]